MENLNSIIEEVSKNGTFCKQDIDLKDMYNVKFLLFHEIKNIINDHCYLYGIKCNIPFNFENNKTSINDHNSQYILLMIVNNLSGTKTLYEKVIENIRYIEHKYNILYMNSQTNSKENFLIILLDIGEN